MPQWCGIPQNMHPIEWHNIDTGYLGSDGGCGVVILEQAYAGVIVCSGEDIGDTTGGDSKDFVPPQLSTDRGRCDPDAVVLRTFAANSKNAPLGNRPSCGIKPDSGVDRSSWILAAGIASRANNPDIFRRVCVANVNSVFVGADERSAVDQYLIAPVDHLDTI